MRIAVLKDDTEPRVPLMPDSIKKLSKQKGVQIVVEQGLTPMVTDEEYKKAGAMIESDREKILKEADVMFWVNSPTAKDVAGMKKGSLSVSFLDPYNNKEIVEKFMEVGVDAISLEMLPRTTLAQKMDALSSQASLAGYVAVIQGANKLDRIFPMMMTPAGTIPPARVFVIGAGVAGLQAIATAKRLGARVEAFDTRAVVEEQVESLGAKFIKIDLGETGQTKDGYAKALTAEQLQKQQEAMLKSCVAADLVITTAKVFGRKAPIIITKEMLKKMRDGAVVVDLAAGTGGNVEGVITDQDTTIEGVQVVGLDNMPGEVAYDASSMYSSNLTNLFTHFYDEENEVLGVDSDDEIMQGCLIVRGGELVNARLKEVYGG